MRVWAQSSQRSTWPPSAAVRQISIAVMTRRWARLRWASFAARQPAPWRRKTSATSRIGRGIVGERRGFLLARGLLGHGRCGGRGLVPLNRLRLARHRAGEHLAHARDRNDLEPAFDAVRDFDKILGVLFGN